jgi:hypothetical protein
VAGPGGCCYNDGTPHLFRPCGDVKDFGGQMDAAAIQSLLGVIPGGGIAALAIWFALRKDNQCTALMTQMAELARLQAVSASEVKTSLDSIRDAIRVGTRS